MAEHLNGADDGIRTQFEIFPDKIHMSFVGPAVNRAISIAFALGKWRSLVQSRFPGWGNVPIGMPPTKPFSERIIGSEGL